ncbi:MAG TPA: hypothetical protein VJ373_08480 [Desulfatiglandales bacterium]|nr:hypothetical protein [Desulfatiglandales bacterium]
MSLINQLSFESREAQGIWKSEKIKRPVRGTGPTEFRRIIEEMPVLGTVLTEIRRIEADYSAILSREESV